MAMKSERLIRFAEANESRTKRKQIQSQCAIVRERRNMYVCMEISVIKLLFSFTDDMSKRVVFALKVSASSARNRRIYLI